MTANEAGVIVNANAHACEAFGYELDDLRGRNLSCLMPDPFSDHHQHFVERFLATGEARVLDKRIVVNGKQKSGAMFPLVIRVSRICFGPSENFFLALLEPLQGSTVVVNYEENGVILSISSNHSIIFDTHDPVGKKISQLVPHWKSSSETSRKVLGKLFPSLFSATLPSPGKETVLVGGCRCLVEINRIGPSFMATFELVLTSVAHLTISTDGEVQACSDESAALFGMRACKMVGLNLASIIPGIPFPLAPYSNPHELVFVQSTRGRDSIARRLCRVDVEAIDESQGHVRVEFVVEEASTGSLIPDEGGLRKLLTENHLGQYAIGEILGQGVSSAVRKAVHSLTGMPVAIKLVSRQRCEELEMKFPPREIEFLRFLNHPNIATLYECVETASTTVMIEEYLSGGDLFSLISVRSLSEAEARSYTRDLVSAVDYLHGKGIIHHDLKLENCVLSGMSVKVIDLGLSAFCKPGEKLSLFCGSPDYAAPELFRREPYLGPPVDVWALGVILYVLVTQFLPFSGVQNILAVAYSWPPRTRISLECRELIDRIFRSDIDQRASLDYVKHSEWLNKGYETPMESPLVTASLLPGQKIYEDKLVVRYDILAKMHCDMGMDAVLVIESLRAHLTNQLTATYKLMQRKYPSCVQVSGSDMQTMLRALEHSVLESPSIEGLSADLSGEGGFLMVVSPMDSEEEVSSANDRADTGRRGSVTDRLKAAALGSSL